MTPLHTTFLLIDTNVHHIRFFGNTGAVAGTFLAVGIIITAIAAAAAFTICRKRRRRFIRQSISRPLPYPENPFEDPRDSPSLSQMQYAGSESSNRNLVSAGIGIGVGAGAGAMAHTEPTSRNLLDDEMDEPDADVPPAPLPPSLTYPTLPGQTLDRGRQPVSRFMQNQRPPSDTMGLAGIGSAQGQARRNSFIGRPYNGPFSDYHGVSRPSPGSGHGKSFSTGGMMDISMPVPMSMPMSMPSVRTEQTRMISQRDAMDRNLPLPPPPSMNVLRPPTEVPSVESSPSIYPASLPLPVTR